MTGLRGWLTAFGIWVTAGGAWCALHFSAERPEPGTPGALFPSQLPAFDDSYGCRCVEGPQAGDAGGREPEEGSD